MKRKATFLAAAVLCFLHSGFPRSRAIDSLIVWFRRCSTEAKKDLSNVITVIRNGLTSATGLCTIAQAELTDPRGGAYVAQMKELVERLKSEVEREVKRTADVGWVEEGAVLNGSHRK